ncbi:cold-shock protein [Sphingosinicella microcystinivorans]|nr:cold-shock protein [Sphingosinicella microcystinivorans]WBX84330.1 cold-shock protein [Sphingosinicella microcystinivorans]
MAGSKRWSCKKSERQALARGEVKWFNRKKGFGFIRPDVGTRDVFVHVSALHQSNITVLADGQRVEFELTQLADGRTSAMGVRIIEDSSDESGAF